MLKIGITMDASKMLAQLRGIAPDRFMRIWAVTIKNLAKANAQKAAKDSAGRSFWQREVLPSVHEEVGGARAMVFSDSNIAEHVHTGGVIRHPAGKFLAIPLDRKVRNKSPRDPIWHTKDKEPVFLPRKRGPGWVLLDAVGRKNNKMLKPLFVLVRETEPQKPRPWWPTQPQIEAETERFFNEDF